MPAGSRIECWLLINYDVALDKSPADQDEVLYAH